MIIRLLSYILTVPMEYVDALERKHPMLADAKLPMQLAIIATNKVTLNKYANQNRRMSTKTSITSQQSNT